MTKRIFTIRAIWDAGAGVYFSESDIDGLHIEAQTLAEFEEVLHEHALDLVLANHISKHDLEHTALADLIPTIIWERPVEQRAVAA
jgi:Domain of unknown function (DUF1902)